MVVYTDALGAGWDSWSWDGIYDFASTEQVAAGDYAISAGAQPTGTLALLHDNFPSSAYYWLELYVYISSDASSLAIWINNGDDQPLCDRQVEDCRYIELQPIVTGIWTCLRIPLKRPEC